MTAALVLATAVTIAGTAVGVAAPGAEGARVGADRPATAMDEAAGPASNSPVLAVDPTEERFVVMANRLDAPIFGCALQVSGDAGHTWSPASPVPELPEGADTCYAPEVDFDRHGRLLYLFVGLVGGGNEPMGAFLTTSDDRGRSFSPPQRVLGPGNFGVRMAVDRTVGPAGRVHLAWLHATSDPPLGGLGPPPNPVLAAHSDDGGRTFSEPVQVSDASRRLVAAPALAVGPGGAVRVAYYDLGEDVRDYHGLEGPVWEGTWAVVITTSTDRGATFGPGAVVDDAVVPSQRVMLVFTMPPPSIAVGSSKVCAAWTDARRGDDDAVLRCSRDGGTRWDGLRRLNDDRVGNGLRQYLPRIAVSPDGRVDAVFLDRRDDPDNVLTNAYFTTSPDGRRFAANRRLSSEGWSSRYGQRYVGPAAAGLVEAGSRLGLLARDDDVVTAWPDSRNATDNRLTPQDIFVATVSLEARGSGASTPLAVVVVAAVAAAGAVVIAIRRRRSRAPDGPAEAGS